MVAMRLIGVAAVECAALLGLLAAMASGGHGTAMVLPGKVRRETKALK